MTNIASGDQLFVNSLIGNSDQKANSKFITFYKTYSGLGLLSRQTESVRDHKFHSGYADSWMDRGHFISHLHQTQE